ncbi:hypothetical protein ODZ84_01880 [Chryseobacterium fluminis]|uniref:hypothetical protein n=1 Tax=Chryseobacterium fluminis TaxID=2983606 RepID=UPI00225C3D7D|nr:hypothetical protein [Chryseobacterium sp. MMS21-Ot14]UZT98342.1 hypothetical protein ODZ84_01880 [Chryseobacterium sp. MMS21-Ot14]
MDKTIDQIKPESITEQVKPENSNEFTKPEGWDTKQTKSPGVQHKDPNNPRNNVREMEGNENSPNPLQQKDYIDIKKMEYFTIKMGSRQMEGEHQNLIFQKQNLIKLKCHHLINK